MPVSTDIATVLSRPVPQGLGVDVADRIRTAILSGHFGPGERLREEALARATGVSRGPIREALAQLEREGLIVIQRNRGTYVAQLSREDLDEVYTLRVAVERLAVERATARAATAALDEMQGVVDDISRRMTRGISVQEAAELDLAFHDLVYRAADHRRLHDTWSTLRPQIHILLLARNVTNDDFRELVVPSHQLILDALRDRDEERAVAVTLDHLLGSYRRVLARHDSAAADACAADGIAKEIAS